MNDVKTAKLLLKHGASIACAPTKLPSYKQAKELLDIKAGHYTLDKREFEENANSMMKLLKKKKIKLQRITYREFAEKLVLQIKSFSSYF